MAIQGSAGPETLLEGAWKKLIWGSKHLTALVDEIASTLESQENTATAERQSDSRYVVKVNFGRWPVDDWSLRLGDAIHSIRGALEHAAWEIVCRTHGLPDDEREQRRIQFPIFDSPKGFANAAVLRYVDAGTRAIFEDAQPYKTGKALQYLAALSNDDKHRLLLPNLLAYGEGEFDFSIATNEDIGSISELTLTVKAGDAMKASAEVGYFDAEIIGPDPQVRVQGEFPGFVAFKAQGGVVIAGETLIKLATFVELVLKRLQANLEGWVPR
jgi:hypothetical protein